MTARRRAACTLAAMVFLLGCEREARRFHESPGAATPRPAMANPYEGNAWAVAEGKRLFSQFNCVGCHAHGGGAIGPPLMDAEWIYGGSPASVYASIVEGRPNGMPSFRGRVTTPQAWQLAAYVRSMSGLVPKDVAPGRSDHLYPKAPELAAPDSSPGPVQVPPAGTRP